MFSRSVGDGNGTTRKTLCADPFGDSFNSPTLSGSVTSFEQHNDLESFLLHAKPKLDQLGLKFREMLLELPSLQFPGLLVGEPRFVRDGWSFVKNPVRQFRFFGEPFLKLGSYEKCYHAIDLNLDESIAYR